MSRFAGYNPACKPAAGVGLGLGTSADWWDAATNIQVLTAKACRPLPGPSLLHWDQGRAASPLLPGCQAEGSKCHGGASANHPHDDAMR